MGMMHKCSTQIKTDVLAWDGIVTKHCYLEAPGLSRHAQAYFRR